jgi:hypothetical protein
MFIIPFVACGHFGDMGTHVRTSEDREDPTKCVFMARGKSKWVGERAHIAS